MEHQSQLVKISIVLRVTVGYQKAPAAPCCPVTIGAVVRSDRTVTIDERRLDLHKLL
jgi:hypothetical protein